MSTYSQMADQIEQKCNQMSQLSGWYQGYLPLPPAGTNIRVPASTKLSNVHKIIHNQAQYTNEEHKYDVSRNSTSPIFYSPTLSSCEHILKFGYSIVSVSRQEVQVLINGKGMKKINTTRPTDRAS